MDSSSKSEDGVLVQAFKSLGPDPRLRWQELQSLLASLNFREIRGVLHSHSKRLDPLEMDLEPRTRFPAFCFRADPRLSGFGSYSRGICKLAN
ncbi:hypothetical protein P8C59_005911 [Phyllachora maydis]|uniref:Uncharacterized protein n=1 Tax=Phyllachora maydis TaxID=1825666 RepID=A0AAD9MBZ8_9PEZI|nr:hypothetical protein P8C59_005911 [Phyllachora maydis]